MNDQINSKEELRKIAFEALVKEAGEFYGLATKTATLFLGGIIVFIEKIAPHKTSCWMCIAYVFLTVGIFFLLTTIYLVLLIRKKNIESADYVLKQQYDKSENLDKQKEKLTNWMVNLLVLGITFITVFGLISFFSKIN